VKTGFLGVPGQLGKVKERVLAQKPVLKKIPATRLSGQLKAPSGSKTVRENSGQAGEKVMRESKETSGQGA